MSAVRPGEIAKLIRPGEHPPDLGRKRRRKRTSLEPCHVIRLSAYMPARAFSLSTRRIVESGIVKRTDLRSTDVKARYGGIMYSLPALIHRASASLPTVETRK